MVPRGGRGALIARLRFPGQSRHVPEGHTSPRCVERVSSHGTSCRRTSAIDGLFQERRRRTPGTWRRWTDEQRKICTSVIDAGRRMLSLLRKLRESQGTGHGQEVSVGHRNDWHVGQEVHAESLQSTHDDGVSGRSAQVIPRSIDSQDKYGVGRWEIVYGFRAYMRDHPCRSTLFKIVYGAEMSAAR
jgi:hypothetical protein